MFLIKATTDDYFSGCPTEVRGARAVFEQNEEVD